MFNKIIVCSCQCIVRTCCGFRMHSHKPFPTFYTHKQCVREFRVLHTEPNRSGSCKKLDLFSQTKSDVGKRLIKIPTYQSTLTIRSISSVTDDEKVRVTNQEVIAKLLGIHAQDVIRTPLKEIGEERASRTWKTLQDFGFPNSSIHQYPELLLMNAGAVENYIRIMQESCFPISNIKEAFILRFRTVCKQSITVLQKKVHFPQVDVVVARYCSELEEGELFRTSLMDSLPENKFRMTLFDLRCHVISTYFQKLSLGSLEETKSAFKKYPRLHYRSMNWIRRNFRVLKEFGFTEEKIRKHLYLLHGDPNNILKISAIDSLGGMKVRMLAHSRPKILMSSVNTLKDIENALVEHEISFESVQKYPEVFTLSSATIRRRLHEIESVPEFTLLKTHPRVARLLYYQNKARLRLEEFRTMQVRMPSLHILSADTKRFNKSISNGDIRLRGVDAMIYLSNEFDIDKKVIRESISRHPHWIHIPLVNVKSVLKYLQSFRVFSNDQIVDAIPILLYPKDKVEKEVENVLKSGEAMEKDKCFLQMVLYFLERSVHFSGDAVWHDKIINEEDEADCDGDLQK